MSHGSAPRSGRQETSSHIVGFRDTSYFGAVTVYKIVYRPLGLAPATHHSTLLEIRMRRTPMAGW